MDSISSALADAFGLLRTDLYRHLDDAESLALECYEWSPEDMDSARKLITDLMVVIRGLLMEHTVAPSGNCRICPLAWPCPVVTTIHALVTDPDREFVALANRVHDGG
ncbi:MAG: hypothetical protein ACRDRP_21895 [Pseudonocardiaceae bacterium]